MRNKKGIVEVGIIIIALVIGGIAGAGLSSGQVHFPNFKAKPKTIDTMENMATPEWDR